jgi:hypothetical protein
MTVWRWVSTAVAVVAAAVFLWVSLSFVLGLFTGT